MTDFFSDPKAYDAWMEHLPRYLPYFNEERERAFPEYKVETDSPYKFAQKIRTEVQNKPEELQRIIMDMEMILLQEQRVLEDLERLQSLLHALQPYVIVVGSFARGTQTRKSDIDFYIKRRPQAILDSDEGLNEYYTDKVIEIFKEHRLSWDSSFIGHVRTLELFIPIEANERYRISKDEPIFELNVFGVPMKAARDDKNLKFKETLSDVIDPN